MARIKRELTEEDYAELDRQGKLPLKITPALIRYCAKHGHVSKVIHTAARLRDELAGVKRGVWS